MSAPSAPSRRHHAHTHHNADTVEPANTNLFIDPMMGAPLAIYIEKDIPDKDAIAELIVKHGGTVSPGYSGVPYILVDPRKESGQNLYRQYAGKKSKIILDARWVRECVNKNELQAFQQNWAGCRVTGNETVGQKDPPHLVSSSNVPRRETRQSLPLSQPQVRVIQPSQTLQVQVLPSQSPATAVPGTIAAAVDPIVHAQTPFQYPVYPALHPLPQHPHPHATASPRMLHTPTAAPPQTWQGPNGIAPAQTHIAPAPPPPSVLQRYRDEATWDGAYSHTAPAPTGTIDAPTYDYRYAREDQGEQWVGDPADYYDPAYEQHYDQPTTFINEPGPSNQNIPSSAEDDAERPRGRKRTRVQNAPGTPAASLVVNARRPPVRSPTPPTRVIKSTYGGNLFTSDDVLYLKRYIDYCQEQGLVLSLREICERIAVKAPHHTFYSWRRYCNKHQIRLGGYAMATDRAISPAPDGEDPIVIEEEALSSASATAPRTSPANVISAARLRARQARESERNRSPTPPRALYRSTTGKGVAFTDEDVTFLLRFMEYRKSVSQDRLDMVAFWKDVAARAPHHSRASWMKYWRRHKHVLNHTEGDDPLPTPPEKKMRYSREDDVLLAEYFFQKPEGTSDKVFQAFGRLHPHHPWKGWQEHHRIHKAKIDHLVQKLANGESIDVTLEPTTP